MRYDKPGLELPPIWGPPPDKARVAAAEAAYEERLKRLSEINASHLRNGIVRSDETALDVANHIGRYISDIDIVDLIRAAARGDRYSLHETIRKLMEESITHLAEAQAAEQIERFRQ